MLEEQLAVGLGRPPSQLEIGSWKAMSPKQRDRAIARMDALRLWISDDREGTAADVAAKLGIEAKRFYNMASAWRRGPTLAALGTFSRVGERKSRLDSVTVNMLQSVIPAVVRDAVVEGEVRSSIETLSTRAEERVMAALGDAGVIPRMPSRNIVRTMVQREVDRTGQARLLGNALRMDSVGTSLVGEDGAPHIVSMLIERAAGVVLGFAVGGEPGGARGYADAARDALVRGVGSIPAGVWADGVTRIDVVPGDEELMRSALQPLYEMPGHPDVGFAKAGDFGRYVRAMLGERVGRTLLRPARVVGGPVVGDADAGRFTSVEARVRMELDLTAHNAAAIERLGPIDGGDVPEALVIALTALAEMR